MMSKSRKRNNDSNAIEPTWFNRDLYPALSLLLDKIKKKHEVFPASIEDWAGEHEDTYREYSVDITAYMMVCITLSVPDNDFKSSVWSTIVSPFCAIMARLQKQCIDCHPPGGRIMAGGTTSGTTGGTTGGATSGTSINLNVHQSTARHLQRYKKKNEKFKPILEFTTQIYHEMCNQVLHQPNRPTAFDTVVQYYHSLLQKLLHQFLRGMQLHAYRMHYLYNFEIKSSAVHYRQLLQLELQSVLKLIKDKTDMSIMLVNCHI